MTRILIALSLLLFSCSDKKPIPEEILSQEKMQVVLWDVIRADELVSYNSITDSSLNKSARTAELYSKIFKIHGISKTSFEKSMQFYQLRPDLLQPILDSLKYSSERKTIIVERAR